MKLLKIRLKALSSFLILMLLLSCSSQRIIFRTVTVKPPGLDIKLPSTLLHKNDTLPLVVARIETTKVQIIAEDTLWPSYFGHLEDIHGDTVVKTWFHLKDKSFRIFYKPDTIAVPFIDTIRITDPVIKGDDWAERIIYLIAGLLTAAAVLIYRKNKKKNGTGNA